MELSFYSVLSYNKTPVAVILIGHSGCFIEDDEQVGDLPSSAQTFVRRILEQLQRHPSVRNLKALRDRLGEGPTQLSELLPITFTDAPAALESLAKLRLR
jgi:hypothetical protein